MSASATSVKVDLGARAYDIHVGSGLLPEILRYLPLDLARRSLFIVADESVAATHAHTAFEALKETGARSVQMLALPAGEATKSFGSYEHVVSWLLDHGIDRESVVFAVGGGVVGDLAGFAAATILRGVAFVQVPTTLLAQVDSSVGGKTGINAPQGKNMIGAFHQPLAVICDVDTLATLPERERRAGYAEIVKYGLINDAPFFEWLEREGRAVCALEHEALIHAVGTACRKKAEIVAADETEKGARALLNLGHTFAHALETAAGYDGRLLHGEAVAVGMVLAFRLSEKLGLCGREAAMRVRDHLAAAGLPVRITDIRPALNAGADTLLETMGRDKKAAMGMLTLVLADGIGAARVVRGVAPEAILAVIETSIKGE